jgi:hypothetical protein
MNGISGSSSVASALSAAQVAPADNRTAQMSMLQKALKGQQSDTAQLLQMLEGKGKIIDIRA